MTLLEDLTSRGADERILGFVRSVGYKIDDPRAVDDLMALSELVQGVDVCDEEFDFRIKLHRGFGGIIDPFIDYCRLADRYKLSDAIIYNKMSPECPEVTGSIGVEAGTAICYELRDSLKQDPRPVFNAKVDNVLGFITHHFQPEIAIMTLRAMLSTFQLPVNPDDLDNWQPFADKYETLIVGR